MGFFFKFPIQYYQTKDKDTGQVNDEIHHIILEKKIKIITYLHSAKSGKTHVEENSIQHRHGDVLYRIKKTL